MFDHICPAIGNGKPNTTKQRCIDRIATGDAKCAKCDKGIGYIKPPPKKRGRKPGSVKTPGKRMCACGRHELKRRCIKCAECVSEKRVKTQAADRRHRLKKKIEVYELRLVEFRKRLSELKSIKK